MRGLLTTTATLACFGLLCAVSRGAPVSTSDPGATIRFSMSTDSTDLVRALGLLSGHRDGPIEIRTSARPYRRVSCSFMNKSYSAALKAIADSAGATLTQVGDTFVFGPPVTADLIACSPTPPRWLFSSESPASTSASVGPANMVYVACADNNVYALNGATGDRKWVFGAGREVRSSPHIGPGGALYVQCADGTLLSLDATTGRKTWEAATDADADLPPIAGANGLLYLWTRTGRLFALDAVSGTMRWKLGASASDMASTAVNHHDVFYIGGGTGVLRAVEGATGRVRWEFRSPHAQFRNAAIGTDGTLYIEADYGSGAWSPVHVERAPGDLRPGINPERSVEAVFALDTDTGVQKWVAYGCISRPTPISLGRAAMVRAEGHPVIGTLEDMSGSEMRFDLDDRRVRVENAVDEDGTAYVTTQDGKVLAFR